jgi:hypothetical protein
VDSIMEMGRYLRHQLRFGGGSAGCANRRSWSLAESSKLTTYLVENLQTVAPLLSAPFSDRPAGSESSEIDSGPHLLQIVPLRAAPVHGVLARHNRQQDPIPKKIVPEVI